LQVYTYRGIQGFKQITNFNIPAPALAMKAITMSTSSTPMKQCEINFLSVTSGTRVIFYEAITEPKEKCTIKTELNCDEVFYT
jgi:hypothetical protein